MFTGCELGTLCQKRRKLGLVERFDAPWSMIVQNELDAVACLAERPVFHLQAHTIGRCFCNRNALSQIGNLISTCGRTVGGAFGARGSNLSWAKSAPGGGGAGCPGSD